MGRNRTSIKKGQVLNPNGRPKGTPNRTTQEMKDFIATVLSENLDRMREDFDKMNPSTRWMLWEKFGKYVIPTLAQTTVDANVTGDIKIKIVYEDELGKEEDDMNNLDDNDIDLDS